jgi:hypothetical protein
MGILLGVVFLGVLAALAVQVRWPSGQGPYDVLPAPWVGTKPVGANRVTASSGNAYDVESWPVRGADLTYHVARLLPDSRSYLSYTQQRQTGLRQLHRSFADGEGAESAALLAQMRTDFGV